MVSQRLDNRVAIVGQYDISFIKKFDNEPVDKIAFPDIEYQYSLKAVLPDGKVGWIQPIGGEPKSVTQDMTEVYGVGAFLLAGTEIYKLKAKR